MIYRICIFIKESMPMKFFLPYSLFYALGLASLFSASDDRIRDWNPGLFILINAATIIASHLIIRAVDDIRDLPYDRIHNARRTLARGAVYVRDLLFLIFISCVMIFLLNFRMPSALALIFIQIAYVILASVAERNFNWPSGESLIVNLIVSLPIQVSLSVYLYFSFLHQVGLDPRWNGAVVVAAATAAILHVEFSRKITRVPKLGERTYVRIFGLLPTIALAISFAFLASALTIISLGARISILSFTVASLPLLVVIASGLLFFIRNLARWPIKNVAWYILAVHFCLTAIGLQFFLRK